MFKALGLKATAVVNSEAAQVESVAKVLKASGWELGAHGRNNSSGYAQMSRAEEETAFAQVLKDLEGSPVWGVCPSGTPRETPTRGDAHARARGAPAYPNPPSRLHRPEAHLVAHPPVLRHRADAGHRRCLRPQGPGMNSQSKEVQASASIV